MFYPLALTNTPSRRGSRSNLEFSDFLEFCWGRWQCGGSYPQCSLSPRTSLLSPSLLFSSPLHPAPWWALHVRGHPAPKCQGSHPLSCEQTPPIALKGGHTLGRDGLRYGNRLGWYGQGIPSPRHHSAVWRAAGTPQLHCLFTPGAGCSQGTEPRAGTPLAKV